jgi:phosphatidylglycerophosphatase A
MTKDKITFWQKFIGSFFFIGKIKGGGTWSSIVTGVLLFFFLDWNSLHFFIIFLFVLLLSISLSQNLSGDPSWFTLDEVIGTFITFAFHNKDTSTLIIGLVLFRLFDIFKLPLLKKAEKTKIGIVLDDVLAGIFSSISLFIIHSLKSL